jgi:hypothetical protein
MKIKLVTMKILVHMKIKKFQKLSPQPNLIVLFIFKL